MVIKLRGNMVIKLRGIFMGYGYQAKGVCMGVWLSRYGGMVIKPRGICIGVWLSSQRGYVWGYGYQAKGDILVYIPFFRGLVGKVVC